MSETLGSIENLVLPRLVQPGRDVADIALPDIPFIDLFIYFRTIIIVLVNSPNFSVNWLHN